MSKTMYRVILLAAAALTLAGCGESGRIFGFDRGGPDEFTVVRNPPLSVPPEATLRPPGRGEAAANRDNSSNQARASLLASGADSADSTGSAGTLVTGEGAQPYNGGALTASPTIDQPALPQTQAPQGTVGSSDNPALAGSYPQTQQYGTPGVPIRYGAQSGPSVGEAALARRAVAYYGIEADIRRKVNAESAELAEAQENFLQKVLFWRDPEPPGTALDANAESRRLRENEALGKPVNAGEAPMIARKKTGISGLF